MGNMPQNIFFLDSLKVKWLLSYHGNRKRMFGMKYKMFSNHFKKCLADLKCTNCIQKYQFCEKFLCSEHLNQTSLFEQKVGSLSDHITLTKESIKS